MSYDPNDYNRSQHDECPGCTADHRSGYRFQRCDHPGCSYKGCELCMHECDIAKHHGNVFCPDHLEVIHLDGLYHDLLACPDCRKEEEPEPAMTQGNLVATRSQNAHVHPVFQGILNTFQKGTV